MLDIKAIRENGAFLAEQLSKRNLQIDFAPVIDADKALRSAVTEAGKLKNTRNSLSEVIAKEKPDAAKRQEIIEEVKTVNLRIKELDAQISELETQIHKILREIPNIPGQDVPHGKDENQNVEVEKWGELPRFNFPVKDHIELGEQKNIFDFVSGAKMAGSRFTLLKGHAARMERALINFMLDIQVNEHGYEEYIPPFMVNYNALYVTGQLPKFEEDLFKIDDNHYMIPTAEVPLTNIYSNQIIPAERFPILSTAYTPCFRSEAGSYGKDVKGYLRQHQFNKVELVWHTLPEQSENAHQTMLNHAKKILQLLELPFRVVLLCGGDMGFSAQKCYDIEVWLPSQNKYREISSCSNCGDFQARRGNIRFKNKDGNSGFAHTLNGSGLAVGRTLIAIMENFQTAEGNVVIPKILRKYMNGLTEI